MRIGIDYRAVTIAPLSGIARQVLALEQALLRQPEVELLRFTGGPQDHPHRAMAVCPDWYSPVHKLHRPPNRLRFELGFLPKALRQTRPDVYIATANSGLPVWNPPRGIRYVLLLHDVFQITLRNHHRTWLSAQIYRQLDRVGISRSVALADQVWSPSQFTLEEAARLFPAQAPRFHVLPNGVAPLPPGTPAGDAGMPGQRFWWLVGSWERRKNIPWFLRQWQAVRASHPGLIPDLVVVGQAADVPGALRQLPGVRFVSNLTDGQLQALYAGAERLWHPSLAEGFGLPVIEALGQGTPVAVARGSALDEVAPAEAIRFDPANGPALQGLMMELALPAIRPSEEPGLLRQWAARFDMPAYGQRLWQLLDQLTTGGPE